MSSNARLSTKAGRLMPMNFDTRSIRMNPICASSWILSSPAEIANASRRIAQNRLRMKLENYDRRYLAWALCLVLLGLLPALAGFAGAAWELSQVCGLVGLIACIVLAGAPIRPRLAKPRALLALRTHAGLGWIALGAVALHIGGLLLSDHRVLEYLMPTAPLYQLAGIAAAILLVALTVTAIAGSRRRLWGSHRGFQATHITMSCALLCLSAAHVIVTGRYAGSLGSRWLVIAALAGGVLILSRARPGSEAAPESAALSRRLVFGRHSAWVLSVLIFTAIAAVTLSVSGVRAALREPIAHRGNMLPLDFPHSKHVEVSCAACHHNFLDDRGLDTCIQCHRSSRADLKMGMEARFHGFCFECHRHPESGLTGHGPVSECTQCHRPPSAIQ
jgi:Class III cytochrome C family/Ferric reductase like transmembrane component